MEGGREGSDFPQGRRPPRPLMGRPFRVTKRNVIFSKGPIHLVDSSVRMPGGRILSRQILEHPGAVVIIPKRADGRYLLIKQFRFAARDWLWEFPAGGIEKGETLRQTARRELMEEVGFAARILTPLIRFYPTPGISGEIMYLYLAEGLRPAHAVRDEDEEMHARDFSLGQIEAMIRCGTIVDGKTILSFLCLKYKFRAPFRR